MEFEITLRIPEVLLQRSEFTSGKGKEGNYIRDDAMRFGMKTCPVFVQPREH